VPQIAQRTLAAVAVVLLGPLLAVLAVAVRLTSPGPALHRAVRQGRHGTFVLLKLRTMRVGAAGIGPAVTAAGDPRVTAIGRILRRTKLDELPQLWNVVVGDMALVGPRPEDPRFIDWSDPLHRRVFSARPGITGLTALRYRNEEALLAEAAREVAASAGRDQVTEDDLDRGYRERVLPLKLAMDAAYLDGRSLRGDLVILGRTIGQVLRRTAPP
jgi:lipopolysaccharide/colanic/teichoic acid biosynthesis glycosyltransferase